MRSLDNVRAEFSLTALANNLRRAIKYPRHRRQVGGRPGVTGDAILAGPAHMNDDRVITAGICAKMLKYRPKEASASGRRAGGAVSTPGDKRPVVRTSVGVGRFDVSGSCYVRLKTGRSQPVC